MIADDFNKKEESKLTGTFCSLISASNIQASGFSFPGIGAFTFGELQQFVKGKKAIKEMWELQLGCNCANEYELGVLNGLVLAGIEFGITTQDDFIFKEDLAKWIQD